MIEFAIFTWVVATTCFLIVGLLTLFGKNFITTKIKSNVLYLLGLLILSVVMFFYITRSISIWDSINGILYPLIQQNTGQYQYIITETWYTVIFFKNMWPAILIALVVVSVEDIQHPVSARYRMLKQFSHNKLLIMVGSLFAYFIVKNFDNNFATFFLSTAVYSAAFYWRFGYAIIIYILRKSGIPYWVGVGFMMATIIISGEYFLLALIMCIGVGLSDIWMDYYHRDAASLVFNFDYH